MTKQNIQKKIGIIGGGQLGKMMILEAKKMGFYITILDPVLNCPAHTLVDEHIVADFDDEEAIRLLASKSDVITYEFEHIDSKSLKTLEKEGMSVYPTAASLEIIQNKYTQKKLMQSHSIPVPEFVSVETVEDIKKVGENFGYPMLLKACTGGYDGKGNFVIKDETYCTDGFEALGNGKLPLMAERFFPFMMEISVLACRAINGDIEVYPVAENVHHDNILFETRVPANISTGTSQIAVRLARKVMEIFDGVGMFCVEMFVDRGGEVAVNEVAPRPHNSGHYSIEACITSQFEQHIRAISGMPLGSAQLLRPAVMCNILGEEGSNGKAIVLGADDCLGIEGAFLHIYGKENSQPKRKMGHITVISNSISDAIQKAEKAHEAVKIIGENTL